MERKGCDPEYELPILFTGCMWSQKTTSMMAVANHYKNGAGWVIGVFTPVRDTRSGVGLAKSHDGLSMDSINCAHPYEILSKLPPGCRMVFIEELHMWLDPSEPGPESITAVWNRVLDELEEKNIRVCAAGLDKSYKGTFFEAHLALAKRSLVKTFHSWCKVDTCGAKAVYSGLVNSALKGDDIIVGAEETFTVMCRKHFLQNLKDNGFPLE